MFNDVSFAISAPQQTFFTLKCTANLLRRHLANISATYASEGTAVEVGFPIIPRLNAKCYLSLL